jgi:hypothetical protein
MFLLFHTLKSRDVEGEGEGGRTGLGWIIFGLPLSLPPAMPATRSGQHSPTSRNGVAAGAHLPHLGLSIFSREGRGVFEVVNWQLGGKEERSRGVLERSGMELKKKNSYLRNWNLRYTRWVS